jgi:outer membrane protein TolC
VSLRNVETSASRAATLTQQRYRAGTSSALDWLDAERTRFSAQQNRIAGDADLIKDYVASAEESRVRMAALNKPHLMP